VANDEDSHAEFPRALRSFYDIIADIRRFLFDCPGAEWLLSRTSAAIPPWPSTCLSTPIVWASKPVACLPVGTQPRSSGAPRLGISR
jgi:hypothetical protein